MRIEVGDISDLRPLLVAVVNETVERIRIDEAKLNGRLGFTESEAAAAIGVAKHVLRDARLRGEVRGRKVGKSFVYSKAELLRYLEPKQ
jgi:hypothetical protein